MLSALSKLRSLSAARRRRCEGLAFCLHYRATFLLLMCACALLTTSQFAASPGRIQCQASPAADLSQDLLNSYCWAASTYSVSTAYLREAGVQTPHPGVAPSQNPSHYIYRNYYQYVHLVLFVQALLFYAPHLLWKSVDHFELSESATEGATYIEERWGGTNNELAVRYYLCEVWCLLNLTVQSYFINVFLHGEFFGLGFFYVAHYHANRLNDPVTLFPLVTSCQFRKFGASGYVDVVDALCVLPLNALNVKIYLFAWCWFTVLTVLTVFSLLHMTLSFVSPRYRVAVLRLAVLAGRRADKNYAKVLGVAGFGDWFVLSGLRSGMEAGEFRKLMDALWRQLAPPAEEESEEKDP